MAGSMTIAEGGGGRLITVDFGAAAVVAILPSEQALLVSEIKATNANGACTIKIPVAIPGKHVVLYNNSGQTATLMVLGGTGITVANGKRALLVCEASDFARVTADT